VDDVALAEDRLLVPLPEVEALLIEAAVAVPSRADVRHLQEDHRVRSPFREEYCVSRA
jgi:hypothetical protein